MALVVVDLVLCVLIVALGPVSYKQNGNKLALITGAAFALFGISNLLVLLGFGDSLESLRIAIRVIAYLLIVMSLFKTDNK